MWCRPGWVLLWLTVGCSSEHVSSSPRPDAGEAGASAAGGAAGSPSAGAAAGDTNDAGAAGTRDARGTAHLSLVSLPGSADFAGAYATVRFAAPDSRDDCPVRRRGACELRACPESASGADAGRIYLISAPSGYHVNIDPVLGAYPPHVEEGIYPAEGDPVLASAAGHTAPSFHVDGSMPIGLVVTTPRRRTASSNVILVPRSADLVLRWDDGVSGISAELEGDDGNAWIRCSVDSALGGMTVPASVLAMLGAGTPLVAMTVAEAGVSSENYDFTLRTAVGVYDDAHVRIDFELE